MKHNDEQWGWSQNQTTKGPANIVKGLKLYFKSLSVLSRETDPLGSVCSWPLNHTGLNLVSPLTCSFFLIVNTALSMIESLDMEDTEESYIHGADYNLYTELQSNLLWSNR